MFLKGIVFIKKAPNRFRALLIQYVYCINTAPLPYVYTAYISKWHFPVQQ